MVLTSHETLGETGRRTGFWFEEFALPYYAFRDAGTDIVLASPEGGYAPVDPASETPSSAHFTRFRHDPAARAALGDTLRLDQIHGDDFDAVYYPGGHGALWDLSQNTVSANLIADFHQKRKTTAFVCHGVAALLPVRNPDGTPFVAGKRLTGLANSELVALGLDAVVPLRLENELVARGASYGRAADGAVHVVRDGTLITGQNSASTAAVARAVMHALS